MVWECFIVAVKFGNSISLIKPRKAEIVKVEKLVKHQISICLFININRLLGTI